MPIHWMRAAAVAVALSAALATPAALAQSRNLAPGFTARPAASKLVVVPADMELFSLSAGGIPEPRADWTAEAQKHFAVALKGKAELLGARTADLSEKDMDEFAQLNALHGAVAEAVFIHHMLGMPQLPTKDKLLDWSLGEAVQPLRAKTGADYALFFWVRDSYASAERKAAMVALALLGVGITGGQQIGYASLVDLQSGRVVWFNNLARMSGDLREAKPAEETLDSLLAHFPKQQ
ncbi:MAG: hypothetical protein HY854_24600 [Burkholderiales bacterium]|nr:hypothetical protein [Burkholderiales bacterium]